MLQSLEKLLPYLTLVDISRSKMMESSSPAPIDLSVPKSNPNSSLPAFDSLEYLPVPQHTLRVPLMPNFYPAAYPIPKTPNPWYMQYNISTINEMNPCNKVASTDPIQPSSVSVFNTPSVSPDNSSKSGGSEQGSVKEEIEKMGEQPELGIKRRLSQSSTTGSSSNFSGDSNNNEKCEETQFTATAKSKYSPEKKKSRTISEYHSETPDRVLSVPFPKSAPLSPILSPTTSSTSENDNYDSCTKPRATRPFKAITSGMIMDPLPFSGPLGDYETFRQNILAKVNPSSKTTNLNMRRQGNAANTHITDPTYWEKRKRNNEAAKRSRDARRRKEDEVAIRCAYLEQERIVMMQENKMLKEALDKCHRYGMIR